MRKGLQKYALARKRPTPESTFSGQWQAPAAARGGTGLVEKVCTFESGPHQGPSRVLKALLIRRLPRWLGPAALLLLGTTVALAATLTLFTAVYEGANVRVDWEVNTETDMTGFELARKGATETSFTTMTTVVPTGQRRYQYLDTNVYRMAGGSTPAGAAAGGGPYTYRLTIRGPGGDQSFLTVLAGTPSAVQRSWGTIKSMFR